MSTQPTHEQQTSLDFLYARLKSAKSALAHTKRAHKNAILYRADAQSVASIRSAYNDAAAEYNALVDEINALTAPFRAEQRAERNAQIRARREERQQQERAAMRAAACTVCGTLHAGEC